LECSCLWIKTWTLGKNEERFVNAFETWCWRRMLKIKRKVRMANDGSFSKGIRRKIAYKNHKNRRHLWIGHIITHNEFVVNILEGAIAGIKAFDTP
jgi:hypothetical protein